MSKIFVGSCFHCGHLVGLTPPEWQIPYYKHSRSQRAKYALTQREVWKWYTNELKKCGPFDWAFIMGDLIDGDGGRSGGTELITTDRTEQCDMAIESLSKIKTKKMIMVFGTPYHAGQQEDFEADIAKEMKCKIGSHEFPKVGGFRFDLKHHVGTSKHKHLRFTPLATDIKQNRDWAMSGSQHLADCVIRGHTHYFVSIEDEDTQGVICPAMQGYGSKFGARRCSGRVNVGFVVIETGKNIKVTPHLADKKLKCLKAT